MKPATILTALCSLLLLGSCKKETPGTVEFMDYNGCFYCKDLHMGEWHVVVSNVSSGDLYGGRYVYWRLKSCWWLGYREKAEPPGDGLIKYNPDFEPIKYKRYFVNRDGCSIPGKRGYFAEMSSKPTATITSFSPVAGAPGDSITITGYGFVSPNYTGGVFFDDGGYYGWSKNKGWNKADVGYGSTTTSLTVAVPQIPKGSYYINVTNNTTDVAASSVTKFTVTDVPANPYGGNNGQVKFVNRHSGYYTNLYINSQYVYQYQYYNSSSSTDCSSYTTAQSVYVYTAAPASYNWYTTDTNSGSVTSSGTVTVTTGSCKVQFAY